MKTITKISLVALFGLQAPFTYDVEGMQPLGHLSSPPSVGGLISSDDDANPPTPATPAPTGIRATSGSAAARTPTAPGPEAFMSPDMFETPQAARDVAIARATRANIVDEATQRERAAHNAIAEFQQSFAAKINLAAIQAHIIETLAAKQLGSGRLSEEVLAALRGLGLDHVPGADLGELATNRAAVDEWRSQLTEHVRIKLAGDDGRATVVTGVIDTARTAGLRVLQRRVPGKVAEAMETAHRPIEKMQLSFIRRFKIDSVATACADRMRAIIAELERASVDE